MASRICVPAHLLQEKQGALSSLLRFTEELLARTNNLYGQRVNDIQHSRGDVGQHQSEAGRLLAELGQVRRMVALVRSLQTIADKETIIWDNTCEVNDTYRELLEELRVRRLWAYIVQHALWKLVEPADTPKFIARVRTEHVLGSRHIGVVAATQTSDSRYWPG